jgi:tetratricopeptide (TPR) repeat protein
VEATSAFLVAALLAAPAAPPKPQWHRALGRALQEAQELRRPVLVYFDRGNCGYAPGLGEVDALGIPAHGETLNECERFERDVWSDREVTAEAARFTVLLPTEELDAVRRRFLVSTVPTVLFTDPWGNEVIRVAGYTLRDAFLKVMKAIPADFSALERWGPVLARGEDSAPALAGAARFYQGLGLGVASERYYERAMALPALAGDTHQRREIVIARGVNFLKLQRPDEAFKVLDAELATDASGPGSDLLLLGMVMARLQSGQRGEAERAYTTLREKYPTSAATARAAEHIKAAEPPPNPK